MNAYFREQKEKLYELMIFVDETALLHDYLDSLSYEIEDLEGCLKDINSSYGHKCLNQGTDAKKRTYLLYRTFLHICDSDLQTLNFGWYYANSTKFQDMAKAFGDRLIYPFVEEILVPFDEEKFYKALSYFVGKHDYRNFTSKEDEVGFSFEREIYSIDTKKIENKITITLHGNGFMRYMIRFIIGTAIAFAKGQIELDFITSRLDNPDRQITCYKAASKGLFLKEVIY
jgi:tRNA pseudouridine(38-40) synthase